MTRPLTYEALIDELMGGVHNSYVHVDPALLEAEKGDDDKDDADGGGAAAAAKKPPADPNKPRKKIPLPLNSNDALFATIRDYNVSVLSAYLSARSKKIQPVGDFVFAEHFFVRSNALCIAQTATAPGCSFLPECSAVS